MKYKNITLLYLFLIGTIILSNPKVALVLSGGSAKGYAHIPVLEMIDSLNIDVDLIVGTSIEQTLEHYILPDIHQSKYMNTHLIRIGKQFFLKNLNVKI